MKALAAVVALALLLGAGVWALHGPAGSEALPRTSLSPARALAGADTEGFARAFEPRPFSFPEDHGPHPGFRTEWWYLTGHLDGEGGERFAFQVTFFRNALTPEASDSPPQGRSEWRTNQVYLAHFALTNVREGHHRAFERMARGAVGLAGASARPFRVWVDTWFLEAEREDGLFPLGLHAAEDDVDLRLRILAGKPPVLQGEDGLSRKGAEPGNASYYYSFTRLPVEGRVRSGGGSVEVRGLAWMDREWSTSALEPGHVGWDWFSVQLDDGRELMYFQLRRRDGRSDPFAYGVLVEEDGSYRPLGGEDVELAVLGSWASPRDGAVYPSGWRLSVPDEGLVFELRPTVPDQEMDLTFRYWEGAVDVQGVGPAGELRGRGFVELTGYAEVGARSPTR